MHVAVIGAGMIGAAAARHLVAMGHEVTLIGPGEPADKRSHRGVFSSHYDAGRITRRLATDPFWARVAAASIARYEEIARQGGQPFHTPCGTMLAGPADSDFMRDAARVTAELGLEATAYPGADLAVAFPCFAFPAGFAALHEAGGAGHIDPRKLVAAQITAARNGGARLVPQIATGLSETPQGVRVHTQGGEIEADAALIATGAMTDHVAPRAPGQRVFARTVALFEVSEEEAARLEGMPCLVFRLGDGAEPYLLPPIRYPDGRLYLKLGGDPDDIVLHDPAGIGDWYRSGGRAEVRDHLEAMIRRLMPGLAIRSVGMDACTVVYTQSGHPVIDRLSPRIAVATGGCGAAAKSSDELGRLGAVLVTGGTDPLLAETRGP
ncbi:FAD-dependent oxidoreductase [Halovulum dunhuangense]|uniref:FAD-dependent oxidoreductase n=1 Tax=Halovulum dunhuangense TaxID=1505036 RepID=A0A849L4V3_9RHOB|nr:FAD-dependent oxidoreductase [Halovulum dunhuangense]NNU81167.1 FAD-dependent oxidoreductase [Halovulum dunhuangense]